MSVGCTHPLMAFASFQGSAHCTFQGDAIVREEKDSVDYVYMAGRPIDLHFVEDKDLYEAFLYWLGNKSYLNIQFHCGKNSVNHGQRHTAFLGN